MAGDLYKNLIDKFLSGLKINSTNQEELISKPDNEAVVINEELTGAISGNKMYGDMPGLLIEANESAEQECDIFSDVSENNEVDPLDGIEVIFFYLMNRNLISEITSYSHSTIKINGEFKTIEDVSKYFLQQHNIKYTPDDVDKFTKILIMLNSNGYETTLNKKISDALENINNGKINYIDYNEVKEDNSPQKNYGQEFYKNIGLLGGMCSLADNISLDSILSADLTQNDIIDIIESSKFNNSERDISKSYTYGTFFEILNIIAKLPLRANRPIQAGIKAINNTLNSGDEITGVELLKIFYCTQDSVIKSGIGQFNGVSEFNANANNNVLGFIDGSVRNDNANKYFNNAMLENLKLLLSFESAKLIMKQQVTDKFENYNSNNEIESILDNFNTLKDVSFQAVAGDDGNFEYVIRYNGKIYNIKTIGEVISIILSLASSELSFKQTGFKSEILSNNTNNEVNTISVETDKLTQDGNFFKIDIDNIKTQLFQGGVKFNGEYVGKFLDDGNFVCQINNGYVVEIPAENLSGRNCRLVYTSDGELKQENIRYINADGTCTSILKEYGNKEIKRIFSVTFAGDKIIYASEDVTDKLRSVTEYFYKGGFLAKAVENTNQKDALMDYPQSISVKKVYSAGNNTDIYEYSYPANCELVKTLVIIDNKIGNKAVINIHNNGIVTDKNGYSVDINKIIQESNAELYDSPETMINRNIPEGYYYNKKSDILVKINNDRIRTEVQGDENFGEIKLYDDNEYVLGKLLYKQSNDGNSINIYSFDTRVKDIDVNAKLMEELLKIAEKYDKDIVTTYQCKAKDSSKLFDIKSYYKIGFQAEDSGIDKLIRKCLTKNIAVPESISQMVVLRYIGDTKPSKQIPVISLQKIYKELEAILNNDEYLINVEYKDLFQNPEKLDYENITQHIDNIKKCIDNNFDGNNLKIAINNGYFSSSKGAEAFETFYNMFANSGANSSSESLNTILTHFDVKNFENAKRRGLIGKLNVNNVEQINTLAKYTDRQYSQILKFADMGIEYISDNDDINHLAMNYVKDKTGNSYSQEEIEAILLQVNDSQKIVEIANNLIKADNSLVTDLLKYTKNPKFVALNLNNFSILNTKLHNTAKYLQMSKDFDSDAYKDMRKKIYSNTDMASMMFDIDASGKYTDEQLYEIGIRINNDNKDFVKKLALSDSATSDEVLRILNDTRFLTLISKHNSKLNASQKLESYKFLLSMPEHLRLVCKDCGFDIDSEIRILSEQFDEHMAKKVNKVNKARKK